MRHDSLEMAAVLTGIMSWEDGVELDHAIVIGRLQAPEEGRVETRLTFAGFDPAVVTRRVAVPIIC